MAVIHLVTEGSLTSDELDRVVAPRDHGVLEQPPVDGTYGLASGPYTRYERTLEIRPSGDGVAHVIQRVEYELDIPWWGWLFDRPIRAELRRLVPNAKRPWWLPPEVIDRRSMRVLATLTLLAIATGYQTALLSQALTYAVKYYHSTSYQQSIALSATRVVTVASMVLMVLADRRGRKPVLLAATFFGAVVTALGALAPSFFWLSASQVGARFFTTTAIVLLAIFVAEEMPAGSRAYSLGILAATGVVGEGIAVGMLPIAGAFAGGWRILFAAGIGGIFLVHAVRKDLPETKRYAVADRSPTPPPAGSGSSSHRRRVSLRGHGRRLALLVSLNFLLQSFALPTSQFLNQFLRTQRHFSAAHISLFQVMTTVPGGIGLVLGGRLAENVRIGRRKVGAFSLTVGSLTGALAFLTSGWQMWFWHAIAMVLAGSLVPALTIYGPELFPTGLRGKANGVLNVAASAGSIAGLLVVGALQHPLGGFGYPMTILAAGPLVLAVLLMTSFPETAHRELEELNPEDAIPAADPGGATGCSP